MWRLKQNCCCVTGGIYLSPLLSKYLDYNTYFLQQLNILINNIIYLYPNTSIIVKKILQSTKPQHGGAYLPLPHPPPYHINKCIILHLNIPQNIRKIFPSIFNIRYICLSPLNLPPNPPNNPTKPLLLDPKIRRGVP